MKRETEVYSLEQKRFGMFIRTKIMSGHDMYEVQFEDESFVRYEYKETLIDLDKKYTNVELWRLAQSDIYPYLPKGTVIQDKEENQMIFTGKSFQLYYSKDDETKEYIGMCKGDEWEIVNIDEKELEKD